MVRRCRLSSCYVSFTRLLSSSQGSLNPGPAQIPCSGVRAPLLAVIAILTLTGFVLPVAAQNPPSQQAMAPLPTKPALRQLTPNPSTTPDRKTRSPLQPGQYIYENGPINGTVSKWEINGGFAVSDSFVLDTAGTITGLSFGAWLSPGDVLESAEVSITSTEFGGTSYFDQTVNFTASGCESNGLGFNVCTESGTFSGPSLNAGTYWLNVSNATSNGHPIYWDENSGVDCHSTDCPSLASESEVGTIPSESFTLSGTPGNQTTTTLAVTPDPASAGQVVVLAATVLDQNQHPVTVGTVSFFNGNQLLGTVQSFDSPPTTALLRTRFGPGTYSITAQYDGNLAYLGSQSAAQPLTVTGSEPTVSALTATSNTNGTYNFNLSVFGYGFADLGGPASLTQNGFGIGTINVPGPGSAMFLPQQTYGSGPAPAGIAVGDFNGDGIADLAVTSYAGSLNSTFSVLLGKADGSFQAPINTATGPLPVGIAVGDFDGDGRADVAVADSGLNEVEVRLGNGDGTFQPEQIIDTGNGPVEIVVADFNGDGNADLAVTNWDIDQGSTVTVLLGDGAGHFPQQLTLTTGRGPYGIVAADFNGDGFPDLAVVNHKDNNISVFINKGDGTFQQQMTYDVGRGPVGIAAGDFQGNGNVDLAVTNYGEDNNFNNTVSVLIGNGDGTFNGEVEYPTGSGPYGIAVGVFNPNGIADLVTADQTGNTVTVIPGNGDGTFDDGESHSYTTGSGPSFVVAADFNGDGGPDIAVTNFGNSGSGNEVSIFLGGTSSPGELNDTPVCGVGQQNMQSNFAPSGSFYAGSLSNIVPVQGDGLNPTTTILTGGPSPSSYLQPLTFNATVTVPPGCGNPTGTATYSYDQTPITGCVGLALQNGSVPSCPTTTIPVGTHCITAAYSGDSNFAPSQSSCLTQIVNKAASNVAATSSPNPSQYDQTVTIVAVVSGQFGGNPTGTVDFRDGQTLLCGGVQLNNMETAVCVVQNLSGGTHSQITACYSGDTNFQPGCGQDTQVVNKAAATVTVSSAPNPSQFGQLVTITSVVHGVPGGASPSGTVTFTDIFNGVQTTLCSALPVNQACSTTILACGTHSQLVASYSGDQNYLPSNGTDNPPQVVTGCGDFALLPISPGSVQITQTYNNNNDPFFAQTINVTVQPVNGYSGTVSLSCSVSPTLTDGTCTVTPPTSGSLAGGNLNTTLTISVGGSTPVCDYTVTVQAQDASGLMHSASQTLGVVYLSPPVTMPTGGVAPPTQVNFWGLSGVIINNFSCPLVSGTGIPGSEDLGAIGGVCSFSPTTTTLQGTCGGVPGTTKVTISGCTIARLRMRTRIYASLWLGVPGLVLLGSFGKKSGRGKKVLRILAILLPILILLAGIGCGGVGQTTPSGSYHVLVQGTGTDGTVYSAVVPVTVTPLGQ